MPGAIPTGSDPTYLTPHPFSVMGGMFSDLHNREEGPVRTALKAMIDADPSLTALSEEVFAGIDPSLGIVAGIIEAIFRRILGAIPFIDLESEDAPAVQLLGQISTFFTNWRGFLDNIDFLDPAFDLGSAQQQFSTNVIQPFLDAVSGVVGSFIRPGLLPLIPIGQIGDFSENLFLNGDFTEPISVSGTAFTHDATVGRTALGSAKTVANGTTKALFSNPILVAPNQKVDLEIWTRWASLTSAADGIQMRVLTYNGSTLGTNTMVDSIAAPSGTQATWQQLSYQYVTPASGVTSIIIELRVTNTTTAGSVWYDDGSALKLRANNLLPQEWISGLTSALAALTSLADFDALKNVLGAGVGTLTAIGNRLNFLDPTGLFDASQLDNIVNIPNLSNNSVPGLVEISDYVHQALINPNTLSSGIGEILPNFQELLDGIRQGAEGVPSTGAVVPDLLNAMTSLRISQTATASRLSQIEARIPNAILGGSGVVGNNYTDDAERAAAQGWGPDWLTLGPSSPYGVSSDGHQWNWTDYSNVQRVQPGIYTAGFTLTDYQIVRDTMATLMESPQAWTGDGPSSANGLIVRANSTGTQYILAVRFYNAVALYWWNGTVYTQIGSTIAHTPRAGARWELRAGDPTTLNLNKYTLLMNDAVVAIWNDTTPIATVGSSNRYGGEYMQSDDRNTGEATPGSIATWSIADNPPPGPMVGSGARVARVGTTGYAVTNQTSGAFPANNYDTSSGSNTGVSPDITYTAASNRFTAVKAGQYVVKVGQKHSSLGGSTFQLLLYKNGALYERGTQRTTGTHGTETFIVWLNAGEYVEPGYAANFSGNNFFGGTDGTETYFSITLANQGSL